MCLSEPRLIIPRYTFIALPLNIQQARPTPTPPYVSREQTQVNGRESTAMQYKNLLAFWEVTVHAPTGALCCHHSFCFRLGTVTVPIYSASPHTKSYVCEVPYKVSLTPALEAQHRKLVLFDLYFSKLMSIFTLWLHHPESFIFIVFSQLWSLETQSMDAA